MSELDRISVDLILCDWAEVLNGKLYLQGAGWSRLPADQPIPIAIAALVYVPYSETNTRHTVTIALVDEDGQPFPQSTDAPPFRMEAQLEVGRPPGIRPGEVSTVPFAAKLMGLAFPAGGYAFTAAVGSEVVARVSFVCRAA